MPCQGRAIPESRDGAVAVSYRLGLTPGMHQSERKGISQTVIIVIVVVVLVVSAGAYVAFNQGGRSETNSSTVTQGPLSISQVTVLIPADVGTNKSLNFEPATITVVVGVNNTIVWVDQDSSASHTVTALSVPAGATKLDSGTSQLLNDGSTFTVTLTLPGTYTYDCSIHPAWMRGTIIVKG